MATARYLAGVVMVAALALGGCTHSRGVADGTPVGQEVVLPLMRWVEAQTGVRVPTLPKVVASRSLFMSKLSNPFGGANAAAVRGAKAAYVPGMVMLDHRDWDPADPIKLSYLVHELVHHAQVFSGKRYECLRAREREAYQLQNAWLEQMGYRPMVADYWINQMASCGERTRTAAAGHGAQGG